MKNKRTTLALVVGRFQPMHDGHRFLIEMAIRENDETVICIGSAQKADPLPVEERRRRVFAFLSTLNLSGKKVTVTQLADIACDGKWPSYLKNGCGITDDTENTFYTGDSNLPAQYLHEMAYLGFKIKIVERTVFAYSDPRGQVHNLTCATEIRNIHKEMGVKTV